MKLFVFISIIIPWRIEWTPMVMNCQDQFFSKSSLCIFKGWLGLSCWSRNQFLHFLYGFWFSCLKFRRLILLVRQQKKEEGLPKVCWIWIFQIWERRNHLSYCFNLPRRVWCDFGKGKYKIHLRVGWVFWSVDRKPIIIRRCWRYQRGGVNLQSYLLP